MTSSPGDAAAQGAATLHEQVNRLLDEAAQHKAEGNIGPAAEMITECLETTQRLGLPALELRARSAMATLLVETGDSDQALGLIEASLPLARALGDAQREYQLHVLLGNIMGGLRQPEEALAAYRVAEAIAPRLKEDPMALLRVRGNAACRLFEMGEQQMLAGQREPARAPLMRAVAMMDELLVQARENGWAAAEYVLRSNRAAAVQLLGEHEQALAEFDALEPIAVSANRLGTLAQIALHRGRALVALGRRDEAREQAVRALALTEPLQVELSARADLLEFVSGLAEAAGDFEQALGFFKRFHALERQVASDSAARRSQVARAQMHTEQARREAAEALGRAEQLQRSNEELARQAKSLGAQALTDALTGLSNRRHVELELDRRHRQARDEAQPLILVMIDVDHFKQINDTHTHAVGDHVLRGLAQVLRTECRGSDLLGRLGGEEFVVVFDGLVRSAVARTAERLRAAVQRHPWESLAPGLGVTASFGVVDAATEPQAMQALHLADKLLYEAKRGGRNRVCMAPGL
jgi:diguanylate cyclase (GGDEF)-like protein